MAHTARGSLADLIQGVHELGPPTSEALETKLRFIFQQMVEEQAKETQDPTDKMNGPYSKLAAVLERAYAQASGGKGKDRHVKAEGQAFEDQPICSLQRIYGNGYAFGQVGKKMEESMRMSKDAAVAELLGGIVYLAAAVIVREEQDG